jgi:hypothetical protein
MKTKERIPLGTSPTKSNKEHLHLTGSGAPFPSFGQECLDLHLQSKDRNNFQKSTRKKAKFH